MLSTHGANVEDLANFLAHQSAPNQPKGRWSEMLNADHRLSILDADEMVLASVDQLAESLEYFEQQQEHTSQKVRRMLAECENLVLPVQLKKLSADVEARLAVLEQGITLLRRLVIKQSGLSG